MSTRRNGDEATPQEVLNAVVRAIYHLEELTSRVEMDGSGPHGLAEAIDDPLQIAELADAVAEVRRWLGEAEPPLRWKIMKVDRDEGSERNGQ